MVVIQRNEDYSDEIKTFLPSFYFPANTLYEYIIQIYNEISYEILRYHFIFWYHFIFLALHYT